MGNINTNLSSSSTIPEMGEQATNTLIKWSPYKFFILRYWNSPYATSYSNSLIMVDPYAMKSQIPALSDWEEMKEEILTRCLWSHQVSHLVFLNQNCTAPPRKCLEICVSHYWHLVGGARNAKHPVVTSPQNEGLSPQQAITPSLTINVLNEGPPR